MADNLTTPVPAGTVLATKDLGTRQLPLNGIADQAGADAMGLVTGAPAANTLLGRLKDIADAITGGPGLQRPACWLRLARTDLPFP
jgi:hypothetical protein